MEASVKIGKSGRFVIPKAIRTRLGLRPGTRLRLQVAGDKFEAVPEADDVEIKMKDGLPVIRGGPSLRKGDIVKAIQADRDARTARIVSRTAKS